MTHSERVRARRDRELLLELRCYIDACEIRETTIGGERGYDVLRCWLPKDVYDALLAIGEGGSETR